MTSKTKIFRRFIDMGAYDNTSLKNRFRGTHVNGIKNHWRNKKTKPMRWRFQEIILIRLLRVLLYYPAVYILAPFSSPLPFFFAGMQDFFPCSPMVWSKINKDNPCFI